MKIFTIGNRVVLGKREGSTITGLEIQNKTDYFAAYLKAKAINDLTTFEVGEGKDIISVSLSADHKIEFDTVKAQYKSAEKRAQGWLVNKVFDDILGK